MRLLAGTPFDRPPVCVRCEKPETECTCPPVEPEKAALHPPGKQTARLAIERRKKGKVVSVIRGLSADGNDLPALLVGLKNSCGAGGTLDGDVLEIQGDHLPRLKVLLEKAGYRVQG